MNPIYFLFKLGKPRISKFKNYNIKHSIELWICITTAKDCQPRPLTFKYRNDMRVTYCIGKDPARAPLMNGL